MRKCRITNFFIVQEQDDYPLQFKVWLGRIATEYRDAWTTKKAKMVESSEACLRRVDWAVRAPPQLNVLQ